MELSISGRVAMVAAGSKGIGKAIALGLAEEGCRVSVCARGEQALTETRADLEAVIGPRDVLVERADVSVGEDLDRWFGRTVERFGTVDILVTNSGGPPAGRLAELVDEQWVAGFEITLMNVVRLTRLVAPVMQEKGWGRIVHVSSLVAKQPSDELTVSSTLRAGLSALTRTMSNQLAPHGILVNAVLPGYTETDRARHLAEVRAREQGISADEAMEQRAAQIPVGRLAEPREIADAVVFFASERASFITGVSLLVDGGEVQASG